MGPSFHEGRSGWLRLLPERFAKGLALRGHPFGPYSGGTTASVGCPVVVVVPVASHVDEVLVGSAGQT
jgi:hypothetical protein